MPHLMGWHVVANAWKYILCKYNNFDTSVTSIPKIFKVKDIEGFECFVVASIST